MVGAMEAVAGAAVGKNDGNYRPADTWEQD